MNTFTVTLSRETGNCLRGVLMVVSEAKDSVLLERLGMTGRELDQFAARLRVLPIGPDGTRQGSIGERDARAAAGAFQACFDLMADAMTMTMVGRDMAELNDAQQQVAAALAQAGYPA